MERTQNVSEDIVGFVYGHVNIYANIKMCKEAHARCANYNDIVKSACYEHSRPK